MDKGYLALSGITETHLEFQRTDKPYESIAGDDLFEFAAIRSWSDLLAFSKKWGSLYCELITAEVYYDVLYCGCDETPPFAGNLNKALSNWDIPRALPLNEEIRQYSLLVQDVPKLAQWHTSIELTSVWWDTVSLFRQLLLLYGVSEGFVAPAPLEHAFSVRCHDGFSYLVFSPSDTSGFMRKIQIVPAHWEAETYLAERDAPLFGEQTAWLTKVEGSDEDIACFVRRYARQILLEIVNDYYRSFPKTLQLMKDYSLTSTCLEGEDRALVSRLLAAFVEFIQGHRKIGLCPECGAVFNKSQSRGTERLFCARSSCKVKASQRRKRFVRECKGAGGSIEYAVVRLGEPYRKSVERWWDEE